jgi:serine/threonine protein kinase
VYDPTVRRDDDGALDATADPRAVADTAGAAPGPPAAPARTARYERRREIARGGMGRIVEAFDTELHREVAIKEVLRAHPETLARFHREALLTARLQHPSIVPLYEAGTAPSGEPYYVMRFLRGQPLQAAIDTRKTVRARLELLGNMTAAADAMGYAHANGIIHRDLKPLNVLVGEFGETVVIDWGLAKDLAADGPEIPAGPYRSAPGADATVEGAIMGTPAYMPPEQAAGEAVDARADVYALGAMLHHVLAGEPPFGGRTAEETLVKVLSEPPRLLPADVPEDLRAIVVKAMAREPAKRYPSARELAEDLRRWTSGRLVDAHRYSPTQLAGRWLRRVWLPLVLIALLASTAVVAALWVRDVARERDRARAEKAQLEDENARLWRERAGGH